HRGDVIAKTDAAGLLTWQSQYEAFGTRPDEAENPAAPNLDRQKANSKDEDPTGLLNEGFRYRDLETGTFISRDPLGLVDGPNIYTYVRQNPWTMFDPKGLQGFAASMNQGYNPTEAQKQNQQILFNAATSPKVWEGVGLGVAGFIPYVGDALDVNDVVHPGSTGFDRTMGSLSLTANAFTAGLAPNAGPIQRGGRKIWSGLQEAYQAGMRSADDAVGVVSDSAQLTLRTRPNAEVQRMLDAGELNISPQAEALLRNLKGSGSSMEVGSDFSLSTLADLQRATQVEFGLFNVGNKNMLVRGRAFEVDVPTDATGVIAHSHNGTNIFSVRPSGADIGVLQRFNQSSSKIVNEAGIATEFTVDRKLLSLWDTTE
ncbi:MAG: RHS repeat-associated core domain-containing protein, partial [Verrucomicrobiota bacterium]